MAEYHATGKISHNAVATFCYNCRANAVDPFTGKNIDYKHKEDCLHTGHFMAENAPKEWKENPLLCWQSVAEKEGQVIKQTGKPARHARKIEFALPKELTESEQIRICDKLAQFYAKKGMCVSYGLHKTDSGNVHCHMMLTLRMLDKNGKWVEAKNRSEYVFETEKDENGKEKLGKDNLPIYKLDENGNKIKIPILDENSKQKFRERKGKGKEMLWVRKVVNVSGWDYNAFYMKYVRKKIETVCNAALRLAGRSERIDCRSYKDRGIKKLPTIHEGYGTKAAERARYNEKIREYNTEHETWEELQAEYFARLEKQAKEREAAKAAEAARAADEKPKKAAYDPNLWHPIAQWKPDKSDENTRKYRYTECPEYRDNIKSANKPQPGAVWHENSRVAGLKWREIYISDKEYHENWLPFCAEERARIAAGKATLAAKVAEALEDQTQAEKEPRQNAPQSHDLDKVGVTIPPQKEEPQLPEFIHNTYKFHDGEKWHPVFAGEHFSGHIYTYEQMNDGSLCVTFTDKHGQNRFIEGELYDKYFGNRNFAALDVQVKVNSLVIGETLNSCSIAGVFEYEGKARGLC